jgi:nucleotide-binding universal stress UspA family protein
VQRSTHVFQIGCDFYDWLFPDGRSDNLRQAKAIARRNNTWVRLLVTYTPSVELHALPWEALHDGEEYLAVGEHSTVARYLRQGRPVKSILTSPPLRMLATTGAPGPRIGLDLDSEIGELRAIFEQYSSRSVRRGTYQVRREVNSEKLQHAFGTADHEQRQYHIWHHSGHGESQNSTYCLRFGEEQIPAITLIKALPVDDLRLIFLNVCSGADPTGLTTMLAEINVPATLGFVREVNGNHAIKFAAAFYRNLLLKQVPIDWAVHQARRSLLGTGDDIWSTVVLFLRTTAISFFADYGATPAISSSRGITNVNPSGHEQQDSTTGKFDVFLCHNSEDKNAIKALGEQLIRAGLRPWLDEWELRPGLPWQQALEDQIEQIRSAAIFVGPSGIGPWQRRELDAYLREFVDRGCPVIPVILPGVLREPGLPPFLKGHIWVDFRERDPDPLDRLIWGITGKKRGR